MKIEFTNENRKNYYEVFEHVTKDTFFNKKDTKSNFSRKTSCHLVFDLLECASSNCTSIQIQNDKEHKNRIVILCSEMNYKVVLERREHDYLFITGYPLSNDKILKEIKKTTPYTTEQSLDIHSTIVDEKPPIGGSLG